MQGPKGLSRYGITLWESYALMKSGERISTRLLCNCFSKELMIVHSTKNRRSVDRRRYSRSNFGSGENIPDRTKKLQEHLIEGRR